MPWDAMPWRPRIHIGLFVHRVDGLAPGIYALARDPDKVEILKRAMRSEFCWQRVPTCPTGLPLYLLQKGDCRALATTVSCGQDIAGDGAFSLAMIADYMDSLATYGARFYRNLFWEAAMVGQVLYLEAEERASAPPGSAATSTTQSMRPSGSFHASGRVSTTSRWAARLKIDGSAHCLRTTSRKNNEYPHHCPRNPDRTPTYRNA